MSSQKPLASLSLDTDNKWSYLKTHGDPGWESFPSYLDVLIPRVLDFLAQRKLQITFFVVGQDAALEKNHDALSAIAAKGHEIGNHSFSHEPWLHLYDREKIENEISAAEEQIARVTGQRPVGFRGPGYSFSEATLEVLQQRGYLYDASTFPTYFGPLARLYYFFNASLNDDDRKQRRLLFGSFRNGFRPLKPYRWGGKDGLLEIPVTTMPIFRVPIHLSYVLYLSTLSGALAVGYFRTALALCRLTGVSPSLLLHPLDFLGEDDKVGLDFFPGMKLRSDEKLRLVGELLKVYCDEFRIVSLREHARHIVEISHTSVEDYCVADRAPNWRMAPAKSDRSIAAREESPAAITTGSLKTAWLTQRLLWLLLPVTLGLAITRQSLWIDEGYTVWFASHVSITTFFSALIGSPGAPGEPQMLFYLFYMWAWVKPFGESEWALRAANIPFAVLFIAAVIWASRRLLRQPNLWVFFCLSPFFWFYLNEARPYVALLAFSAVSIIALLAYLMHSTEYRTSAPWWCLIALLLACGVHIMGAFLFPSMVVLAALTGAGDANVRQRFLRDWYRPILWCSPAFVALAAFYVWASTYGVHRGHGRPGLSNLAFIVYEFLGFGGLGPARGDVRNTPHLYVFTPHWPWLLPGAIALAVVGFLLLRTRPPKLVWYLIASLLVGTAIAVEISIIEHFQVLGRHMAAFFPLLLITLMLWSQHSFSSERARYAGIAAFVALGVAWGISDLRLVFMSKYAKDDYREAASTATARALQDGGKILWAADPHTAHYYGILVMTDHRTVEIGKDDGINWHVSAEAVDARNWNIREATKFVSTQRVPAILVLSKTDLFDTNDGWRTLIQQQRPHEVARLTAFSIYELQPTTSSADGER